MRRLRLASNRSNLALLGLIVLGAVVRIAYQLDRPFIGDEIGTLMLISKSYGQLLTTWDSWQTQHFFLAAEKFLFELSGGRPHGLVALPLLAGITVIPATVLLARALGSNRMALVAGLLVALNPYLIAQSGVIRSYSVFTCLALFTLAAACRWFQRPSLGWAMACGGALWLTSLAHPNGVYVFTGLMVLWLLARLVAARDLLARAQWAGALRQAILGDRAWTLVAGLGVGCLLVVVCYLPIFATSDQPKWTELGGSSRAGVVSKEIFGIYYFDSIWAHYFGEGYRTWPTLLLLVMGMWQSVRWKLPTQQLIAFLVSVPFFVAMRGAVPFPWAYARFLVFVLPLLCILLAVAVVGLTAVFQRRQRLVLELGLSLALCATWMPALVDSYQVRIESPWNTIREHLETGEGRVVALALDWGTALNLGPEREGLIVVGLNGGARKRSDLPELDPGSAVMVTDGFVPECDLATERYGDIAVTRLTRQQSTSWLDEVRACLAQTVRQGWPTEPQYAPAYQFLLQYGINADSPRLERNYRLLHAAAEDLTPQHRFRSDGSRRKQARDQSKRMQRQEPSP